MPAPARYPPAHVQMFELAIVARLEGLDFDAFWTRARRPRVVPVLTVLSPRPPAGAILFPTDTGDRQASVKALDDTKEGWRRAYDGEPPLKREKAVQLLSPVVEEADRRRIAGLEAERRLRERNRPRGFTPASAIV